MGIIFDGFDLVVLVYYDVLFFDMFLNNKGEFMVYDFMFDKFICKWCIWVDMIILELIFDGVFFD